MIELLGIVLGVLAILGIIRLLDIWGQATPEADLSRLDYYTVPGKDVEALEAAEHMGGSLTGQPPIEEASMEEAIEEEPIDPRYMALLDEVRARRNEGA